MLHLIPAYSQLWLSCKSKYLSGVVWNGICKGKDLVDQKDEYESIALVRLYL